MDNTIKVERKRIKNPRKKKVLAKGSIELFNGKYFYKQTFTKKVPVMLSDKIGEEGREVLKEIIKYNRYPTEENKKRLGEELIDAIQVPYSMLSILFEEKEIEALIKSHDKKIKERLLKANGGKLPTE